MKFSNNVTISNFLVDMEKYICLFPNFKGKADIELKNDYLKSLDEDLIRFQLGFLHIMTLKNTEVHFMLIQLVNSSNCIYASLIRFSNKMERSGDENWSQISKRILNIIEETIDKCVLFDKDMVTNLPITDYKFNNFKPGFNCNLRNLKLKFSNYEVDKDLIEILFFDLTQFIRRWKIIQSEFMYIKNFVSSLSIMKDLTTDILEIFLIEHNFNSALFYNYCVKKANDQMFHEASLHLQVDVVLNFEERINNITYNPNKLFCTRYSIIDDLKRFYKEKRITLMHKVELRRTELIDKKLVEENDKIQVNLPVAQFGLLIRLFMDHNLIPNTNVRKIFKFFSNNFMTPSTCFISSDSLQKKSTTVEFSTAKKVKGILITMINWLNENYNTSNYSG